MHRNSADWNLKPLPTAGGGPLNGGILPRAAPPAGGNSLTVSQFPVAAVNPGSDAASLSSPVSRQRSMFHEDLTGSSRWKWSVGVTTAPREWPTLERTLHSLTSTGWEHPHLFAEPDCAVPDGFPVTRRGTRLGAWPNWYLALAELVLKDPLADGYLLVQDDVLFSRNCRQLLEAQLWPPGKIGVVSLYCPSIYHADKTVADLGPYPVDAGFGLVGALTFLFPPDAARALLQDTNVMEHRTKGRRRGLCNIDAVVGRWAQETGRTVYFYAPSLATHIGETSTIDANRPLTFNRTCQSFLGEHFDPVRPRK